MKLRYRGYDFDDDELRCGWDRRVQYSPQNRRTKYLFSLLVRGERLRSGAAALTASLGELEDAVSENNGDLTFLDNTGTATVHRVQSGETLNGVQVMGGVRYPIDPPTGSRTEYLNKRTFEILFQWEIEAPESEIVEWQHDIRTSLGNEFVVKKSLSGLAQQQGTSLFPDYVAVQQGRAVGWSAYPSFPSPQYTLGTLLNGPSYQKASAPLYRGRNGNRLYGIEWRYYFWSPVALPLAAPSIPLL